MKGMIFDIKRFAVHDGPGIRTTVFFKGCPLRCNWCHNPESIAHLPECFPRTFRLNGHGFTENETIGYEISDRELLNELEKDRIFMDESQGGITFSGGEPLFQSGFLLEMLARCRGQGWHTAVDTSLFSSWDVVGQVAALADLFLIDLKLMNSDEHKKQTGVPNGIILENIRKLAALKRSFRIRIPVIKGITDTDENISGSIAFLKSLEAPVQAVDLLPFHNTAAHKYRRMELENTLETAPSMKKEELQHIKSRFESAGLTVTIGG
jgi:pyruvate formate lyase activating enzyme